MNYINILNKIYESSEVVNGESVIKENYFHKLAEDLNTLFALRGVVKSLKEKREVGSYMCLLCYRDKFTHKQPHKCLGGFRKRNIPWQKLK